MELLIFLKEVDVARLVGLYLDHYTRMDCSIPLFNERSEMMVPWPEVESRVLSPIRPFDGKVIGIIFFPTLNYTIHHIHILNKVWIVLALSTIAVSFTLSWLQKFYSIKNLHKPFSSNSSDDANFILNYINTGKCIDFLC